MNFKARKDAKRQRGNKKFRRKIVREINLLAHSGVLDEYAKIHTSQNSIAAGNLE